MRICLLTGGGYPYRRDALGGWCRTLVGGLPHYTFDLVSLTDREPPAGTAYPLPGHVTSSAAVSCSGTPQRVGAHPGEAAEAAVRLCRGLLGEERDADDLFADGLQRLTALGDTDDAPLHGVPLADVLLEAVRGARAAPATDRLPLPRLSLRDARTAAALLRHAVRPLAVRVPDGDLVHCVGGTAPLLTALATRWRTGVPLLLTEARAPIGRPRPAEDKLPAVVRTVLRRFRRAVARVGYAEAGLIAPLSTYHHGWALRQGARPMKIVPVPAGVDPHRHPPAAEPTGEPALMFNGGPGPELDVVLAAFASVLDRLPGTLLQITAATGEDRRACRRAATDAGLARWVHVWPADDDRRHADGHVVVHLSGPADPPYRVIEAMLSGRPVVGVDAGPVAETLGDAGTVVPAGDPIAIADACVALLGAPARRRELADAARRRALAHFTADRVVRCYDALYTDLTAPAPAPSFELALAVPAPRATPPRTVRWLAQEER
jgi:glycosyltransferase involved in cell wall biosynthesis